MVRERVATYQDMSVSNTRVVTVGLHVLCHACAFCSNVFSAHPRIVFGRSFTGSVLYRNIFVKALSTSLNLLIALQGIQ